MGAGEMKDLLHVNHVFHDFGLANVSWNPIQYQSVDVRLELVRFHRRIYCLSPQFHCDVVRNELALARVFEESFADLCSRVDRAKYVATGAMIKARNRPERFALRALAAAWCAKKDKGVVSHHQQNPLIL